MAEANDAAPAPVPLQWVDNAHDLGALCADTNEAGEAATGGHDALVRVWCPAQGDDGRVILQADCSLKGHTAAVTAVRWARGTCGRNVLASAALDRTARLWAASVCLLAVEAHPRYLTCVVLAPDLRYMVTGKRLVLFQRRFQPTLTTSYFNMSWLQAPTTSRFARGRWDRSRWMTS